MEQNENAKDEQERALRAEEDRVAAAMAFVRSSRYPSIPIAPAYHEPQPAPGPLTILYSAAEDVITIEGIRYAGDLFRQFGRFAKPGTVFQFVERNDGVVTLVNVDSVAA